MSSARAHAFSAALAALLAGGGWSCASKPQTVSPTANREISNEAVCVARGAPLPPVSMKAVQPTFTGKLLVPPADPGAFDTEITGCLEAPPTEADGARFPAPHPIAPTGDAGTPTGFEVRLSALRGGILVSHELSHPCCLRAEVTARVQGPVLTVVETLSGRPCRCTCSSTVRTAVGAPPGRYTVELHLALPGQPERLVSRDQASVSG